MRLPLALMFAALPCLAQGGLPNPADGFLDPSFDADGQLVLSRNAPPSLPPPQEYPILAVTPDAGFVIAGSSGAQGQADGYLALTRIASNGALVNGFGFSGWSSIDIDAVANAQEFAEAIAVLPDGRVIVAGNSCQMLATNCRGFATRVSATGQLDGTALHRS